jgi:uncharacterized membrane protein (DUF106 family)
MLKQFSNIEAALILPVISRFLITLVELLMAVTAIIIGLKYDYFHDIEKMKQAADSALPREPVG